MADPAVDDRPEMPNTGLNLTYYDPIPRADIPKLPPEARGFDTEIEGEARLGGPGRPEVSFGSVPFVRAPYWVLWVAEDYRSAVVGVPSGRAGWILHRDPVMPPDRLEAARRILAFNGYDLSALRMTPQFAR